MNFVHILLIVLVEQIYYTILTINKQLPVKKGDNFNEESVNSFINRAIDETHVPAKVSGWLLLCMITYKM